MTSPNSPPSLGLFLDLRNPMAWERPWSAHYARTIALVADAETDGIDAVWVTEHHGFADGYLPQPLTFLAALAARTTRVRLGTAVLLGGLRHPRHVAEEAAVVDLVSGGRLELGIGAGHAHMEFAAFDVPRDERMDRADATVATIRRLWDSGEATPSPVQRPIPLWMGYLGPRGAQRAGRLGTGLLALDPALLAPYTQGLAAGGHDLGAARMGGVVDLVVSQDPERAAERLLPHVAHQLATYQRSHMPPGTPTPSPGAMEERLRDRLRRTGRVGPVDVVTPDDAIALLRRRVAGLPVRHVYVWASIAGMPDDLVDEHLELLCSRVRPGLHTP